LALLCSRLWSLVVRSPESTQQSIDDAAGMEQLWKGSERCGLCLGVLSVCNTVYVCPGRRDQGACAVRQYENKMQAAPAMGPPQHLQRLTLEGMAPPHDGYPIRVAVEVVMGIVSCVPSTPSTMDGW
jgi:hypothetical protein